MSTNYGYCGDRTSEQAKRLRSLMNYDDVGGEECPHCKGEGWHTCPCDCACPCEACGRDLGECICPSGPPACTEHDCHDEECDGVAPCCNFVGGDPEKGGVTCWAVVNDNPLEE